MDEMNPYKQNRETPLVPTPQCEEGVSESGERCKAQHAIKKKRGRGDDAAAPL